MESTSSEDKIAWLRERGVQVNIPKSRSTSASVICDPSLDRTVTIVKIPFDSSLPYENVGIVVNDGQPGDQLIDLLKPKFVGGQVDSVALETAIAGMMTQDGIGVQKATIMDMIHFQGNVEAFPLTRPCESNGFAGVSLYVDEAGHLKGLPTNPRAAALAACCGFESVQLVGDIFVGRLCVTKSENGSITGHSHESFTAGEIDSGAEWLTTATRDNFQHGYSTNQIAMEGNEIEGVVGVTAERGAVDAAGRSFRWTQTEDAVDLTVHLPHTSDAKALRKALKVEIEPRNVRVSLPSAVLQEGSNETVDSRLYILDVCLRAAISPSDSTWSISGNDLDIFLEKAPAGMWPQLESTQPSPL